MNRTQQAFHYKGHILWNTCTLLYFQACVTWWCLIKQIQFDRTETKDSHPRLTTKSPHTRESTSAEHTHKAQNSRADALALKHLRPIPSTAKTSTKNSMLWKRWVMQSLWGATIIYMRRNETRTWCRSDSNEHQGSMCLYLKRPNWG